MTIFQYNRAILAIEAELTVSEQAIVDHIRPALDTCELLIYGNCFHCNCYLSYRYGIPVIVHANAPAVDYMKEQTLSFKLATQFTRTRYIAPHLLQDLRNQQRRRALIPIPIPEAPCSRQHLDEHTCPPCEEEHSPACTRDHLDIHQCPPCELPHNPECEQEHLDNHTCLDVCSREHLDRHTCPTSQPGEHVCFHLECLGQCTFGPRSDHPVENVIPGAFHASFGAQLAALELPNVMSPPSPPQIPHQPSLPTTPIFENQSLVDEESQSENEHEVPTSTTTHISRAPRRRRRRYSRGNTVTNFDGTDLPLGITLPRQYQHYTTEQARAFDRSTSSFDIQEPVPTLPEAEPPTRSNTPDLPPTQPLTQANVSTFGDNWSPPPIQSRFGQSSTITNPFGAGSSERTQRIARNLGSSFMRPSPVSETFARPQPLASTSALQPSPRPSAFGQQQHSNVFGSASPQPPIEPATRTPED
jgi:hypothetical protein